MNQAVILTHIILRIFILLIPHSLLVIASSIKFHCTAVVDIIRPHFIVI
jgi:hypothetical protein